MRADTFTGRLIAALARRTPEYAQRHGQRALADVAGSLVSTPAGHNGAGPGHQVVRAVPQRARDEGCFRTTVPTVTGDAVDDRPALCGDVGWSGYVTNDAVGRPRRWALAAAAIVVLLLCISVAGYWASGRGHMSSGPAATTSPRPAPTTARQPTDIAALAGRLLPPFDVTTFDDAASLGFLTAAEIDLYTSAGASKAQFAGSQLSDGVKVMVLAVQARDNTSAQTAARNLGELRIGYGMQPVYDAPVGVLVGQLLGNGREASTVQGSYAYRNVILSVIAVAGDGASNETVLKDFNGTLDRQLKIAPVRA